jgi:hypothetical protein
MWRRFVLALVLPGLLAAPLSPLLCAADDPAAMACCKTEPQACNRLGSSDACCRSLPNNGDDRATLAASARSEAPRPFVALMPAAPAGEFGSGLAGARLCGFARSHGPLDLPPPLLSSFRV